MAQNIYDENGRKIGEVKSEQEKNQEDFERFTDNIGCLAILLGACLMLLAGAPWLVTVIMLFFEGEGSLLFLAIPILIATAVAGMKMEEWDVRSMWGTFWRTALIDIAAGIAGGLLACLLYSENLLETLMDLALWGLWFSIVPAAIVALVVRRRQKKSR